MELKLNAKVIKCVGGIFAIRLGNPELEQLRASGVEPESDILYCKARGVFRHERITLLAGDNVVVRIDPRLLIASASEQGSEFDASAGIMIDEILPRRNELIRPPMANLDLIFCVFAAAKPEPALITVDKLVTIAEYKQIEPVIVITKVDLAPEAAEYYADIYRRCGFSVFVLGIDSDAHELEQFVRTNSDRTSVFAGASGVGKSTLMNRLFPSLHLTTGEVSPKTLHGRHTTRHSELYPLDRYFEGAAGYIADTPGFGMLDFVRFDFYTKDDLVYVFREFEPYLGHCRYTKCTHTKEEGCAILDAVREGKIPRERHDSYLEFYAELKNKHNYGNTK